MATKNQWILWMLASVAILTFFFFAKNYQQKMSYLSGDEPHYIMMTDSLIKDGDFNLKNDYQLHRALAYYPIPGLFPQVSGLTDLRSSQWYPIHTAGLPLVIAIPYKLFGVVGARIWLMIIQFCAAIFFYLILKKYLKSRTKHYLGLTLLLVCPLFWQNLGAIFPDLILVSMWGLMILLFENEGRIVNLLMICLLLLGGLIHSKGLILMAPLVLFNALWLIRKNGFTGWLKKYWLSVAVLVLGMAASTMFLYLHYKVLTPGQLYGKNGQLFTANPLVNFIAMLTDRSKGLLVYFPILLFVGPYILRGIVDCFKTFSLLKTKKLKLTKDHYLLAGLLVGLAILLVTVLTFQDWSGSTAPNGRNALPFIFVIIFLIAKYANLRNRLEAGILGVVGVLCTWLSWQSIVDFRYYMSTGVNSFWTTHFLPLMHLPLFNLYAEHQGHGAAIRGALLLVPILIFNVALVFAYKYRIILKKRGHLPD